MAENSKIEWTHHTFNPWRGCTKVAPGCANCYADDWSKRNPGTLGIWGPNGTRVIASEAMWKQPLKWNEAAKQAGERHRVFCASLADVFEDWRDVVTDHTGKSIGICPTCKTVETQRAYCSHCRQEQADYSIADVRRRLFALIDSTPHLDWLLLTKRPENVRSMWPQTPGDLHIANVREAEHAHYRPNVWLGTSISDQATADRNIPLLLQCRDLAPVLFVSAEPLLGPVDLTKVEVPEKEDMLRRPWDCEGFKFNSLQSDEDRFHQAPATLDWLIAGGESGHHARPMHPDWARSLRDQCQAAEVPFLFKQWGEWLPSVYCPTISPGSVWLTRDGRRPVPLDGIVESDSEPMSRVGKANAGRLLDGELWDQYPIVAPSVTRIDIGGAK